MQKITVFITILVCCLLIQTKTQAQEKQSVAVSITAGIKDDDLNTIMEYNSSSLLSSFNLAVQKNAKKLKLDDRIATPEAKKKIETIWETSKLLCTESEIKTVCRKTASGELQIRKIPVKMLKAKDPNAGIELLSLNFNPAGQICDIYINLSIDMEKQIVGATNHQQNAEDENSDGAKTKNTASTNQKNEVTANETDELQTTAGDFAERNKILDFVEKFRTAYNCKDIYYIENMYSDNALIISAKRKSIQQIPNTDLIEKGIKLDRYGYDYQVSTKKKYIEALRGVFKRNEYIAVGFDSVQVDKVRGYKMYGVSLYQRWDSPSFRDKGYLFLLIDCQKEDEMQVFIRAWAPEKIFSLNTFSGFRRYEK